MRIAAFILALLSFAAEAGAAESWPRTFVRVEQVPPSLHMVDGRQITVLDARDRGSYRRGHIPGAQHALWTRYRAGWLRSGRLPDDLNKLARELARLGVDNTRPVLVCGSAQHGWGEEGRIAWMIRYLGHPAVAILDGGCAAWRDAGRPFTDTVNAPAAATFTPRPREELRAFTRDVKFALTDYSVQLLDVRTLEEFNGATPYFSSRGGHIPTAVNVPLYSFFNNQGMIKDGEAVSASLERVGLAKNRRIIVYCTGGVRSGIATEILRALDIDAANYDASFWAWSADHSLPVARPDD